ncbi:MAG: rhomboid family intramembrane serine protease [Candidatus Hydrogenedentes bacterium]|nr:rhomboid family intramembrane serine protease [Candidatus Hydrogenedentota bacterium]
MSGYTRFEYQPPPQRRRITYAVQWLILANAIVYAGQLIADVVFGGPVAGGAGPPGGLLAEWLAFQPDRFLAGALWQPVTYMFLHADLLHLFGNMLVLFFFGPEVERLLSTRQFFRFYFLCGLVGVMANVLIYPILGTVSVHGASGATMGVLIAFAMAQPEREVYLFPLPVRLNARGLIIIVIVLNIVTALRGSPVSVATHFGGMGVGAAYMAFVPRLRNWLDGLRRRPRAPREDKDPVGEAVDNILKFHDEKRRRR